MKSFRSQTHYEVLEISVGASQPEIRGAHERLTHLYADDQAALYGLVDPAYAAALRVRLNEALEILADDELRELYDEEIGLPPRVFKPAAQLPPSPPPGRGSGRGETPARAPQQALAPASSPPRSAPTLVLAPPAHLEVVAAPAALTVGEIWSEVAEGLRTNHAEAPVSLAKPSAPPVAPPPSAPVVAPIAAPAPSAPRLTTPAIAGTGWGGSISWVTPTSAAHAPQPAAYTYAVVPPKAVAQPAPVIVVPVPARVMAVPPSAPPAPTPSAPPPPPEPVAPEPSQLALDVSPGVPSWGAKAVEKEPEVVEPPPPAPVEAPLARISPPVEKAPVVETAPPPEPEAPAIPVLADDVEVAIVPARPSANREHRTEQRQRPYEIPEGVEINGDLLKQVRMAKGLSLVQVADRTRIGVKHLENVEGDRYDALPAAVYLRGILMNLARELGLDGLRVSKSYLTFVEAHRSKG